MPKPLAVQLYTFRDTTRPGAAGLGLDRGLLETLAGMGFLGVETVDVPGGDADLAREAIADAGLRVASSHTWADPADAGAFERASAGIAALGSDKIIVSGGPFTSVGEIEEFAAALNGAAAVAARHGLKLGYHNHSSEMHAQEGVAVYRRLRRSHTYSELGHEPQFAEAVDHRDAIQGRTPDHAPGSPSRRRFSGSNSTESWIVAEIVRSGSGANTRSPIRDLPALTMASPNVRPSAALR